LATSVASCGLARCDARTSTRAGSLLVKGTTAIPDLPVFDAWKVTGTAAMRLPWR
jgi:hypothetical protein